MKRRAPGSAGWALGWAALFLLACEVLVRSDWLYTVIPGSPTGSAILKERKVRDRPVPLRVLILGDSRAIYGISPAVLMPALGLPPAAGYNLAIHSGTPFTMRAFWHKNREAFSEVDLVIYTAGSWWLDRQRYRELYISVDLLWMPAHRLFQIFPFPEALANAVSATYRERRWLKREALMAWEGVGSRPALHTAEDEFGFAYLNPDLRSGGGFAGIDRWYDIGESALDATNRHDFETFMGELRDGGTRVVVVEMPYPADAIQRRDALFGPQYERVCAYFQSAASRLGYTYLNYGNGVLAHQTNFYDGLHLNGRGATAFSRLLARDVRARGLAPAPASAPDLSPS